MMEIRFAMGYNGAEAPWHLNNQIAQCSQLIPNLERRNEHG